MKGKEIIISILIALAIVSVGIYGFWYYITEVKCYNEYRILTNQYIASTNSTHSVNSKIM